MRSSAKPTMGESELLKSWAMPLAIWPIARRRSCWSICCWVVLSCCSVSSSIRWLCCRAASERWRAVMSLKLTTTPVSWSRSIIGVLT